MEQHRMSFKVILPARRIPDGVTVTKLQGTNRYVLKKQIFVYTDTPQGKICIPTCDGVRYLCGPKGDINQIDADKELLWMATPEMLTVLLEDEEQAS